MEGFYLTVAGFCFTLIGLWWNVAQTRLSDWRDNLKARRLARAVVAAFLVPGIMSLAAALAGELKLIWQVAFIVAGLIGAFVAYSYTPSANGTARLVLYSAAAIYGMVVIGALIAAFSPKLIAPMTPLQLEGILVALLMLCGVGLAWELLWHDFSGQS